MKINNLIPVRDNETFKRDPKTGALLNCNYEKLNESKVLNKLNSKYIQLENKINSIDTSLTEIKTILTKLLLGDKQ